MYVFLRLLGALVVSLFRSRVHPLEPVRTSLRVYPNDLDVNLHLNNGRYLTLMDIGRFDLTVRSGLYQVMWRHGWLPVLGQAAITFRRELRLWQRFELETQLVGWDDKWLFLCQKFYVGETLAAAGVVKALFKSKAGRVPTEQLLAAAGVELDVAGGPSAPFADLEGYLDAAMAADRPQRRGA